MLFANCICKYSKLSAVTLKSVISDFFSGDSITEAKELLVDSVDKVNIDKWPKPERRKQSDNKARLKVDDIVSVYAFLDENLILDKLPTFVAANVDNIPSNRIEEGDLRCFLNKLDNVENKIDNIPSHHTDEGNLRQLLDKLVSVENKIDILGKASRLFEKTLTIGLVVFPLRASTTRDQLQVL